MSIIAKISPAASGAPQEGQLYELGEAVALGEPSQILLDLSFREVHVLMREGNDLLLETQSGESLRLLNFFLEDEEGSELFFVDDNGNLVAATFPPAMGNGLQPVEYTFLNEAAGIA
ncbi:MAG TPA: BapA prefix-like domain-containing protein, partial [Halomonas sp.]|nr:BapA prefix-like domain-containing protein [Halomonas sp.]